jgi:hypothetical protein
VFEPPCRAEAVGITFATEPPPATVSLAIDGRVRSLNLSGQPAFQAGPPVGVYRLPQPRSQQFEVQVPRFAEIGRSDVERDPHLAFTEGEGDPVARIYCPTDDPVADRIAATYPVNHPDWIPLGLFDAWPVVWSWLARGAFVLAIVGALAGKQPEERSR